jgi:hypothetical protein
VVAFDLILTGTGAPITAPAVLLDWVELTPPLEGVRPPMAGLEPEREFAELFRGRGGGVLTGDVMNVVVVLLL